MTSSAFQEALFLSMYADSRQGVVRRGLRKPHCKKKNVTKCYVGSRVYIIRVIKLRRMRLEGRMKRVER